MTFWLKLGPWKGPWKWTVNYAWLVYTYWCTLNSSVRRYSYTHLQNRQSSRREVWAFDIKMKELSAGLHVKLFEFQEYLGYKPELRTKFLFRNYVCNMIPESTPWYWSASSFHILERVFWPCTFSYSSYQGALSQDQNFSGAEFNPPHHDIRAQALILSQSLTLSIRSEFKELPQTTEHSWINSDLLWIPGTCHTSGNTKSTKSSSRILRKQLSELSNFVMTRAAWVPSLLIWQHQSRRQVT